MKKSASTQNASRANTASSHARNKAIKTTTIEAETRRNYRPPPSATKKVASKDLRKAQKIQELEQERASDQSLY